MVRLDTEQKKEFKAAAIIVPIIALIALLPLLNFVDSDRAAEASDGGFFAELIVFALLFVVLIVALIVSFRKASKKVHDETIVYRTTEGIFNLDDPQSVVEALVLYQDYTSEHLFADLRADNYCERVLFNMFVKKGYLKLESDCLYVSKEANNTYIKNFYLIPLQNTCHVIELFKQALKNTNQDYNLTKLDVEKTALVEELPGEEGMCGAVVAYHLNNIKEYLEKLKKLAKECKKGYRSRDNKDVFENSGIQMNRLLVDHEDEIVVVERDVRQKYFTNTSGGASPVIVSILFMLLFVAVMVGSYYLVGSINDVVYLNPLPFFPAILGAGILSVLATYVWLLNEEKAEMLNERGKAIVDKISGLKNFIQNYTQLKDPSNDTLYVIWDEFVFFAYMFGLSSNLYDAAKDHGKTFDNEGVLDYFKETNCVDRAFDLNRYACVNVASAVSDFVKKKYSYDPPRR